MLLVGLDERSADVTILDQALAERNAGGACEADRRGGSRIGDRQDEVGVDRRFGREPLAHAHPRAVDLDACQAGVRPRQVEELEDAEAASRRRFDGLHRLDAVLSDENQLACAHLAIERRAHEVERARLGRDDRVAAQPAEHQRPEPVPVAEREQLSVGEADDRRRSFDARHRAGDGLRERALVVGDQRRDHLGVGGRGEGLAGVGTQFGGVDEIAVVAERDRARAAVMQERLGVGPRVPAGRRVARVPDRDLSREAGKLLLVEDLRHEPEVAQSRQPAVLADGDPADSWPRCCKAYSPKYVSRATSRSGARTPNTPHI